MVPGCAECISGATGRFWPATAELELTYSSHMTTISAQNGAAAESLAANYLEAQGLTLIARNLRCKAGELDIVCLDDEVLVIVEVRQRTRADFGGASGSVNLRKRRRLLRATAFHCQRQPAWRARVLRFDVITLQSRPDGLPELTWIKDAFRAS